jgi:two-component system CheB/CheR fusion protein
VGVVVTFIDVTSLTHAEVRQRTLIAELQHRTRNLLAIVQAIARQTLGKGGSLDAFTSRLATLGRVQALLSGALDEQIDLGDIVRLELGAVGASVGGRVTLGGPRVPLGFELIQTFGLVLHELATNAVKHGALKDAQGRLDVAWQIARDEDGGPFLILDWRESGVTLMPDNSRKGFGSELIERALAFTPRAKTALSFGADGILCHIKIPLPVGESDRQDRQGGRS